MDLDSWFLTAAERDNPAAVLDSRRADGSAWTEGNHVSVRIDGTSYFARLHRTLDALGAGARVWLTDWEGHADERLTPDQTDLGALLCDLVERGVQVRGLLWRSHPRQAHFAEQDNMRLARDVNRSGGLLALDERVRRGGSHHQKMVIVHAGHPTKPTAAAGERRSDETSDGAGGDVAFIGGIDLCHGRHDDRDHAGDPQSIQLDRRYGDQPPWHDAQLEIHGPAVGDLSWSFLERWNDQSPLDRRNPLRAVLRRLNHQPARLPTLPVPAVPPAGGAHAVQVLRTYPVRRPPFPFAPDGERSVARAYFKALKRARRLVAIEDQYLWSQDAAAALAVALRSHPELHVVIIVPRYPDRDGRLTGAANQYARDRAISLLRSAGGRRVAVYDLENRHGTPIYVHAKVCIIDDVWLEVGSDNLNRRSWTHDSEIACAVIDSTCDKRAPTDPGGLGDGARVLARSTRLALWAEHLGRAAGDDHDLIDPMQAFEVLRHSAAQLDQWCAESAPSGPRPPGHLRAHPANATSRWQRPILSAAYRIVLDPDGRHRSARQTNTY